jgi:hypothetical protein
MQFLLAALLVYSVQAGADVKATVKAGVTPQSGSPPLTVRFSAQGAPAGDPGSAAYEWNFGDGETAKVQHPMHTYRKPGRYQATVKYSCFINRIDNVLNPTATDHIAVVVQPALPPGDLEVTPPEILLTGNEGSTTPAKSILTVVNAGGSTVHWNIPTPLPRWLKLKPVSGVLERGQSVAIAAEADDAGAAAGTYRIVLALVGLETPNRPHSVPVSYILTAAPAPVVRPGTPPPPDSSRAIAVVGATLAGLLGAVFLGRAALRKLHAPKPRPEFHIRRIADPGVAQVRVPGLLVLPSLSVRIVQSMPTISIRPMGPLVAKADHQEG